MGVISVWRKVDGGQRWVCNTLCAAAGWQRRLTVAPTDAQQAYKRLARAHCELGEFGKASVATALGVRQTGDPAMQAEQNEVAQLSAWQKEGEAAIGNSDFALARTFFANMLAKASRAFRCRYLPLPPVTSR